MTENRPRSRDPWPGGLPRHPAEFRAGHGGHL